MLETPKISNFQSFKNGFLEISREFPVFLQKNRFSCEKKVARCPRNTSERLQFNFGGYMLDSTKCAVHILVRCRFKITTFKYLLKDSLSKCIQKNKKKGEISQGLVSLSARISFLKAALLELIQVFYVSKCTLK